MTNIMAELMDPYTSHFSTSNMKLCRPLNSTASVSMPDQLNLVGPAEQLQVVAKSAGQSTASISLKHRSYAHDVPFVVRWVCTVGGDRVALLELNNRTLEPEMGIPQVLVRVVDENTVETLPASKFVAVLTEMNGDIGRSYDLPPAQWNQQAKRACCEAFRITV